MTDSAHSPTLAVNLAAIVRNYRLLASKLEGGACAAVVKANAYGLGVAKVALALYDAGCRHFFVATLEEGLELRSVFNENIEPRVMLQDAEIYVFHGARAGQTKEFLAHRLTPALNDAMQIEGWANAGPYALHIDTGMCRLGIDPESTQNPALANPNLRLVMSHLACANEPGHPKNKEQLVLFRAAIAHFPGVSASLANSSGVFLGSDYHFNLARPGCSLYGISPDTSQPNPMEHVATLSAPVLQYRTLEKAHTVGYSATATCPKGAVIATVEMGYADGFLRALSGKAFAYGGAVRVPVVGRVSMDMVTVDVSAIPAHLRTPELRLDFINPLQPVDALAEAAGTIGYEIFTRLGARVKRIYN